ncbi:hypothetical protein A2U01_0080551, partial [Trifolium medium]|nr:hypothetical protein [Trifolium medium]
VLARNSDHSLTLAESSLSDYPRTGTLAIARCKARSVTKHEQVWFYGGLS